MTRGESADIGPRTLYKRRGFRFPVASASERVGRLLLSCGLVMVMWGLLSGVVLADEELDYGLEANRLAGIEITGNTTFQSSELKKLMRIQEATWTRPLHVAKYQPHLVDTEVGLLETYYRNRGFHQVSATLDSITPTPQDGDFLYISIVEGPRTMIGSVSFVGNGPVAVDKLRSVMYVLEGEPAPASPNAFGGDIYAIRDMYRNETYLDALVRLEMTQEDPPAGADPPTGPLAHITYYITPGRNYTVGRVDLAGNVITHSSLLLREMKIGPGEPLFWKKVEESRRNLLATSLFRDVTIVPVAVDTTIGRADLLVQVIERKPAFLEFGVGVGSVERIRALASWGHYNLWGTGRRIQVRSRVSWNVEEVVGNPIKFDQGQINYRVDATYVNPHFAGSRFSLDVNVYTKRETRGESGINLVSNGVNVGTTWKASRRVTQTAYYGWKLATPTVHPYAPDSLKVRYQEVDPSPDETRSVNWAVFIDHRDDLFRPTSGLYSVLTTQLAGGILGGGFDYFKWSAAWHKYQGTPLGGVLAFRFMLGGTFTYGSSKALGPDGVPYDERFFAGGASSVRGYRQNSLGPQVTDQDELDDLNYSSDVLLPDNPARGGNYLMLTNLEWRFPLPGLRRWKLSGVLFFEGGNVWATVSDIRIKGYRLHSIPGNPQDPASTKDWDYRYSFGTGIRLDTPFGPVRVDVGFPLKRVRYVNETINTTDPSVIWHFSLGYPF